jgi:hypothetical protein
VKLKKCRATERRGQLRRNFDKIDFALLRRRHHLVLYLKLAMWQISIKRDLVARAQTEPKVGLPWFFELVYFS